MLVAADFLGRLREVSRKEESRKLGIASEAFFAANLIVDNVRLRLARLDAVSDQGPTYDAMREFLEKDFKPFLKRRRVEVTAGGGGDVIRRRIGLAATHAEPLGLWFSQRFATTGRPIIFLDFEYSGWDDPAKMIADFLLHPAIELSPDSKKRFASAMSPLSNWPDLLARVESVYPLFGLKWCMIILNEFSPTSLRPAICRHGIGEHRSALQSVQLDKARPCWGASAPNTKVFRTMIKPPPVNTTKLDPRSLELRRQIVRMLEKGGRGHVGSAFSLVEILRVLYDDVIKYNPKNPRSPQRAIRNGYVRLLRLSCWIPAFAE